MAIIPEINRPQKAAARFLFLFVQCFTLAAIAIIFMALIRELYYWIMVVAEVPAELIQSDDVWRMRYLGLRFDARTGTTLAIVPLLISLVLFYFKAAWKPLVRILTVWGALAFFLVALLSVCNFHYIRTFHTAIDIFVFNFLHEEPQAVMTTVWQDYPIISNSIAVIAVTVLMTWIWVKLFAWMSQSKFWDSLTAIKAIALIVVGIIAFVFLARGSLTSRYPLRRNNAQVSVVKQINELVLNAPMALYYANQDRKHSMKFEPVSLKRGERLMAAAKIGDLIQTTPHNETLAAIKPHVAFFIMESMGFNMMSYDVPGKVDLMGSLREHFSSDYVFKRFTSADLHTIQSVAQLLFLSPVSQVSTSSIRNVALPGTPFDVYKKAGYRTVFITSGTTAWENMKEYLPTQHVDEVYDQTHLMDYFNLTSTTEWGVADHYAFEFAQKLLKDAKEPTFIVVLSTSNHPPYHVPDGYTPKPITVPEVINKHYNHEDYDESLLTIMQTYQSSADALGKTIGELKKIDNREIVIAATADHRMLGMKPLHEDGPFKDVAIPFYVWVSDDIKKAVDIHFDPKRVGSHKDIFPTLYALSLSDAEYRTVGGRNMLAAVDDPQRAFGYNIELWANDKGVYTLKGPILFYPWADEKTDFLTDYTQMREATAEEKARIEAYRPLDFWQLNERACGIKETH
mgnify:FL=1